MGHYRQLTAVLVAAAVAISASGVIGTAPAVPAVPAIEPQVVCLTSWGEQATGAYRSRPRSCDLHEHGKYPVAGVNVMVTHALHWRHWGKVAVARGKLGIVTYGWAPVRLRLMQPRRVCGHTVYTKARLAFKVRSSGHTRRFHPTIELDDCLA